MAIQAFRYPVFQPAMRIVVGITNSFPCTVTTSFPHGYITGLINRLYIPLNFGMQQANQLYAPITVTSPTTFTMDINTTYFDPFVIPPLNPGHNYTPAQTVPVGEISSILIGATRNVLPYT